MKVRSRFTKRILNMDPIAAKQAADKGFVEILEVKESKTPPEYKSKSKKTYDLITGIE